MSPYSVARSLFFAVVGLVSIACLWAAFADFVGVEVNMLNRYANGQSVTREGTLWIGLSAIRRGTFDNRSK